MKRLSVLIVILSLVCFNLAGQADTEALKNVKLEAMDKLSFMTGTWEGTGFYQVNQATKENFDIHETIEPKLDGLVYLVEGHGTSNGVTTHKAIALITWDNEKKKYAFESHTFDGRSATASATLNGNTFTWGFDTPEGGTVRYQMKFNKDEWHESGSYSPDNGETWYNFMEMKLNRIK